MEIIKLLKKGFIQISELIRNENSLSLSQLTDSNNNSGDDVKKIDIISNSILKNILKECSLIRKIGSEEEDELIETAFKDAPYLVCYDPLDGSSNVDVNITTGTIFCIYKYDEYGRCKNGHNIIASGYCLYGGATQCMIAYDGKLSFYQYSTINQTFNLLNDNIRIKTKGSIYSLNECNKHIWVDKRYNNLINKFIEEKYSARWIGSLVADAHRTIIKGGFFSYPANTKDKNGKIRLIYEAYPFAYIFFVGGGFSSNGEKNILDIDFPEKIHQKTPITLCGKYENEIFLSSCSF
jgi:fructose-1,6-bisphosphatase I